jgi:predicted nucleic acid-binding protein
MRLFLDTSALLAILNMDDNFHPQARDNWSQWVGEGVVLLTSSYVVVETTALTQRRMGMGAVALLHEDILPVVRVEWVTPDLHRDGVVALLAARRRDLSLVDYTSFELMRRLGIRTAFAFDRHFVEQGFTCLP